MFHHLFKLKTDMSRDAIKSSDFLVIGDPMLDITQYVSQVEYNEDGHQIGWVNTSRHTLPGGSANAAACLASYGGKTANTRLLIGHDHNIASQLAYTMGFDAVSPHADGSKNATGVVVCPAGSNELLASISSRTRYYDHRYPSKCMKRVSNDVKPINNSHRENYAKLIADALTDSVAGVLVSDYNQGWLDLPDNGSASAIRAGLENTPNVVANIRNPFKPEWVGLLPKHTVVACNAAEFVRSLYFRHELSDVSDDALMHMLPKSASVDGGLAPVLDISANTVMKLLASDYYNKMFEDDIERLVVTCGGDGAVVKYKNNNPVQIHTPFNYGTSTVGAGDMFAAALLFELCMHKNPSVLESVQTACLAAAKYVGNGDRSICHASEMLSLNGLFHSDPSTIRPGFYEKPIVVTNGCFDLFHDGHVNLLHAVSAAVELEGNNSDYNILVAVDTDAAVRKLKGKHRPYRTLAARMLDVATIVAPPRDVAKREHAPSVAIVAMPNGPGKLFSKLPVRPVALYKGGEYDKASAQPLPGSEYCDRVIYVDMVPDVSTTKMAKELGYETGV